MPLYRIEATRQGRGSQPIGRSVQVGAGWEDVAIKQALSAAIKGLWGRSVRSDDSVEHFNYGSVFVGQIVCPYCEQPRTVDTDECGGEGEGICDEYAAAVDRAAIREPRHEGYWLRREHGRPDAVPFFRAHVAPIYEHYVGVREIAATLELRTVPNDVRKLDSYVDEEFFGAFSFDEMLGGATLGISANVVRMGYIAVDDEPELVQQAKVALDYFLERAEGHPEFCPPDLAFQDALVEGGRVRFGPNEFLPVSNFALDISGKTGTVTHVDKDNINIKLDEFFPDLVPWDNEATYTLENGDDPPSVVALGEESIQLRLARAYSWRLRERLLSDDFVTYWRGYHPNAGEFGRAGLLGEFFRNRTEWSRDARFHMDMSNTLGFVFAEEGIDINTQRGFELWTAAWDLAESNNFFVGPVFIEEAIEGEI